MDFFADNIVKSIIGKIIENKGEIPTDEITWFSMTRQMFKNHGSDEVLNLIFNAIEEASDKQWFEHKYPKEEFEEKFTDIEVPNNPIKEGHYKKKISKEEFIPSYEVRIVHEKLTFKQLFDYYNIKYKGKIALCPFHNDKNKSLSFSEEKKLWNCFGCNSKGNLFKLVKMLEEKKNVLRSELTNK